MTKIKSLCEIDPVFADGWFSTKQQKAPVISAELFKRFADELGIHWLGLYCMAIIETGYFSSQIFKSKNNLFGIGAVDADPLGGAHKFDSVIHGVEAGAQHLAIYAGAPSVKDWQPHKFVAGRTAQLKGWGYFGMVSEFADLGGKDSGGRVKWASNPEHGKQIERLIAEITEFASKKKEPVSEPSKPTEPIKVPTKFIAILLKTVWPFVIKMFPWLGWATAIVYAIIELLLK